MAAAAAGAKKSPSPPTGCRLFYLAWSISTSRLACASSRRGGPEHPDSGFKELPSTTQLVQRPEKHPLPRIPVRQAIDQLPARTHDLARHTHEGIHKGLELHAQHPLFVLAM